MYRVIDGSLKFNGSRSTRLKEHQVLKEIGEHGPGCMGKETQRYTQIHTILCIITSSDTGFGRL